MAKKLLALVISLVLILSIVPIGILPASAETIYYRVFPVQNGKLAYYYGYSSSYGGDHTGIDIHSTGNDTIYSACGGTVDRATDPCPHWDWYKTNSSDCGHFNTFGNYIRVHNDDGTYSYYGHLKQGSLLVSVGDRVEPGQPIATMGSSGASTGKHLHYELRESNAKTTINTNPDSDGGNVYYFYSAEYYGDTDTTVTYTDITPGVYYIKNPASDGYLNLEYGKDENAANIHILEFGDYYSQMFEITESTTTAGYKIRPIPSSSRYVNVYAEMSSLASGKNVCIYDDTGDGTQRWLFEECSDGYIIHCVGNENLVLDAPTWDVCVSTYTGADTQIWEIIPVTHTVTYDANGGSGAPPSQTKVYGSNLTISSTIPTRDGYAFLGWSTSSETTSVDYKPGDSYSSDDNITLYAVWELRPSLVVNSSNNAVVSTGGEIAYYTFTPSTTGDYVIYSTGDEDTRIYLYANGEQIDTDDDSGDDYNFYLECTLTAGVEYTFAIKYYNSSVTGTISFQFDAIIDPDYVSIPSEWDKVVNGWYTTSDGVVKFNIGDWLYYGLYGVTLVAGEGTNIHCCMVSISDKESPETFENKTASDFKTILGGDVALEKTTVGNTDYTMYYCQSDRYDAYMFQTDDTKYFIIFAYADGYNGDTREDFTLFTKGVIDSMVIAETAIDEYKLFTYYTSNGEVSITDYNGYGGDVVIPETIDGYPVTRIGYQAFLGSDITSVSMPSVTIIEDEAFMNCDLLTSVDIPNASIIYDMAFYDCIALSNIYMPKVTKIYYAAFYNCNSLTTVDMASVIEIRDEIFVSCDSLVSVNIPNATLIGDMAFYNCTALSSIYMPKVTRVCFDAFSGCDMLVNMDMPSVTIIEFEAFYGCSMLVSVSMPNVDEIGEDAFNGCSTLITVSMPSVEVIGDGAFADCTSLKRIYMPSVTTIGDGAFNGSDSVMFYAPLNSVAHNYAVENSIPYFEADDFGYQDGYTYYVSNNEATIVDYNGNGGDITIPATLGGYPVKHIGTKAFYGCESLISVTMPSVTTVGTSAFRNCTSLTTVTMPNVTTLAHQVFQGCSSLVNVEMPRIAEIGDYVFKSCNKELTIYAPDNNYAKQYAEDNKIKLDGAEKIKSVSYKVSGDKVVFSVTTLPVYNRIKVSFADNLSTYITYSNNYTVNSDGNYVFTVSVPAIVGTTEYAFDGRLVTTNKYSKEYCYTTVDVEQDETPTFINVTYTIDDDKIIFTVVTKAGDFNRIKVTTADNLGGSLGVASSYSVNADGNYVWTVKAAAPTANITYAFDLRTSAMKYLKDYHTVDVEYVDTEIFKSVSYEIVGDKIVFTVVTSAGDYNRIKVAKANAVGTSLGVGTYTVDKNGNYVWTVKTDAPEETTTFAFDLRTTANKYLKDYYEFNVEVKESPVIFKSTSYEIVDGKVIFTAVTKAGDYNRVKIALLDNITSYVKYVDTYTVNADGDYVWTLKFNAPTAATEYALDIRVASTMKYVKNYYYVTINPATAEPETVFVSGSGVIADGKLTLTIVTLPTTVNRVKVMLTSNQSSYVKLIDKYTVDKNGNYVWTATVAAPSETTSYTCDVRSSETGRYMKDYFTFEVAVAEEKADIFKSVSYEVVDGKIVFTVVTTPGNYNRIKVTTADNLGSSLGVGSYTVDANGDYVWTVKTTAPTETTSYAFDLRTTDNKYLKDYFIYEYSTEPVPSEPQLIVLEDLAFERVLISNAGIICGKRDGYWGAVKTDGTIIVPFEYNNIHSATKDGYILAENFSSDEIEHTYYLFDSTGKLTYQSTAQMPHYDEEYEEYLDLVGEEVLEYSEGILLTRTNYNGGDFFADYTLNLRKADGTLIKSFDNVLGYSGYTDGYLALSFTTDDDSENVFIVNTKGEILYSKDLWGNDWMPPKIFQMSMKKGIAGGYFYMGDVTNEVRLISKDLNTAYSFYLESCYVCDYYGTKAIFETWDDEPYYVLGDITMIEEDEYGDKRFTTESAAVISQYKYDSMSFASYFGNPVNYALVSRDSKWGFLSLDGKTEVLYDDAGDFYYGKAIVKQDGEIFVINENFEKVSSSITGYDSVASIGEDIYIVRKGDVCHIAVLTK